jgi:hypothetical protein
MKILIILTVLFTSCIVQPEAETTLSLKGTWCTKDEACYTFTDRQVDGGASPYSYYIHNEYDGGYYKEGVIVSELFQTSFGDVYFNLKRDVLVMYLRGVLFRFVKVAPNE